jgi:hypothetical protein
MFYIEGWYQQTLTLCLGLAEAADMEGGREYFVEHQNRLTFDHETLKNFSERRL